MVILHFDLQPQFKYMNYFIYTSHQSKHSYQYRDVRWSSPTGELTLDFSRNTVVQKIGFILKHTSWLIIAYLHLRASLLIPVWVNKYREIVEDVHSLRIKSNN